MNCDIPLPPNFNHLRSDEKMDVVIEFVLRELAILKNDYRDLATELEQLKQKTKDGSDAGQSPSS